MQNPSIQDQLNSNIESTDVTNLTPTLSPLPESRKKLKYIMGVVVLLVISACVAYVFFYVQRARNNQMPRIVIDITPTPVLSNDQTKGCPEDLRTCTDGSVVFRLGPSCEFAACPGEGGQSLVAPDWQVVTVEQCGVKMQMPPENFEIVAPTAMDQGREWLLDQRVFEDTTLPFNYSVNLSYTAIDGLGSGYMPGSVNVLCSENSSGYTTESLFQEVKSKMEVKSNEFMIFTVVKEEETMLQGHTAYKYKITGGQEVNDTKYLIATPEYIYELKYISMSEDQVLQNTTKQIFDSIKIN